MNKLQTQLETLRKEYNLTKVNVYDDMMVFHSLTEKTSPIVEQELNQLITKLNLPLIAEQSSPLSAIRKCVLVKSKF